jgi:hypothetical protein
MIKLAILLPLFAIACSDQGDDSGPTSTDGGSADGGSADGGSADGGSADGGSADGGSADGGSSDGGTETADVLTEGTYLVEFIGEEDNTCNSAFSWGNADDQITMVDASTIRIEYDPDFQQDCTVDGSGTTATCEEVVESGELSAGAMLHYTQPTTTMTITSQTSYDKVLPLEISCEGDSCETMEVQYGPFPCTVTTFWQYTLE